jgi:hypothetical protein
MTEQEWLACPDWRDMFGFIEGKVTDRKLRLFAVACCRISWALLQTDSRKDVELAERHADGLTTNDELRAIREVFRATETDEVVEIIDGHRYRCDFGGSAADKNALRAARSTMRQSADVVAWSDLRGTGRDFTDREFKSRLSAEMTTRRLLLHEILGPLPFRPVRIDALWQTSNVTDIAQTIYDNRAFERLPIFADALEEAGCTNADILNHCRSDGPHVRGCWVVDVILGKQ